MLLRTDDRLRFLTTLDEVCRKTEWQVHAYCLMGNHFHLVVETPAPNLVAGMKWFLGTYTSRFNRRHKLFGHLFSGRYKAMLVEGSGTGYLRTVCDYVHLNPVRAKLLRAGQPLRKFGWSSYPHYLARPSARPGWLRVDPLLGEWRIPADSAAGRRYFEKAMEERRKLDDREVWKQVRRGWCLGSDEFRKKLLARMHRKMGRHHGGPERRDTVQAEAERLLREELARLGWTREELQERRKGDAEKVKIARKLRQQTTMTWDWIAERLAMGAGGYAANCVRMTS